MPWFAHSFAPLSFLGVAPGFIKPSPGRKFWKPPSVLNPFAQDRTFLSWRGFKHLLEGRYPFFIARTDSRASPTGLSSASVFGLVRGVFAGVYQALLPPGLSRRYYLHIFPRMSDPLPRLSHEVHLPVSSFVSSAFPKSRLGRLPAFFPRRRLYGGNVSRLQIFLYVQTSEFACFPDRPHRCVFRRRAAEALTSEQNMLRCLRMHRIC